MSTKKLTSIARRGSIFVAVFAIVAATFAPAASTYADALNPLTERSLTLSSSAPGWEDQDGSGNSTYAPPNSGANGKKSGNYFSFKVSTDTTGTDKIKAMTFQYCTKSAGICTAPGNNSNHTTGDTATTSDLRVTYPTAAEVDPTDFATVIDATTGNVIAVPGYTNNNPKYQSAGGNQTGSNGVGDPAEAAKNVAGNFIVLIKTGPSTWAQSEGWTAASSNQEEGSIAPTGQDNTIILENSAGAELTVGQQMKVLFFATATDYITNPGEGAFFVKINTFKHFTPLADSTPGPENTLLDNIASGDVIDGGVTVANVMNQSIQITTKVLETMQFSVGTVDPATLTSGASGQLQATDYGAGKTTHGPCDIIQTRINRTDPKNVLALGDQSSESSLATDATYATHSYWRLSSNSSAGATVYYSGHTLSNTSGDEIMPINQGNGTKAVSAEGSEQFGLALSTKNTMTSTPDHDKANYAVDYTVDRNPGDARFNYENAADTNDTFAVTGVDDSVLTDLGATVVSTVWNYGNLNKSYHTPRLDPLVPATNYSDGAGTINSDGVQGTDPAKFAFDKFSDTIPTPIADESTQVVDCVTAKMRYIANIAATTPAGIYTTKINYIAAPQY